MKRINSIDIVRGAVMIIMALDHVRDLIHVDAIAQNPTNLETTTPILFFTRWITHLCAPTFVFLAGTSAFLSLKNSQNLSESRMFFIKRGIWLIILEFTLVNFALWFDFGFHLFIFEVIAAIGFGFIILGLLLKFPPKILAIIGLVIIFGHNLFPLIPFPEGSIIRSVLLPLFGSTAIPLSSQTTFIMGYPPIPWLGIMLVGFAAGKLFELENKRKHLFLKIGFGSLVLFVLLRFLNVYGDPVLWTTQKDAMFTFLSFINVTKYPPSLQFCLVILGITFLMLAWAERAKNKFTEIVSVYGKVPLFYFLLHLYLIHLITLAVLFGQGFQFSQFDFSSGTFGRPRGLSSGLELWAIYLIWFGVVAVLYLPCRWYGNYKLQHKENWWVRYL